jgi:hypothetical protein
MRIAPLIAVACDDLCRRAGDFPHFTGGNCQDFDVAYVDTFVFAEKNSLNSIPVSSQRNLQ